MTLPVGKLGTDTVQINGSAIEIRSLSMTEALGLDAFSNRKAEAPAYLIEKATGVTPEEATAFLDSHNIEDGVVLVNAILTLSGLDDTFRARVSERRRARSRPG